MSLSLGMKAQIRTMVFIAGEPIPYFWPMRAFIHHNPLHGLERMPFEEAVAEGRRLFHGDGFLPRTTYQQYCRQGKIDTESLQTGINEFLMQQGCVNGIDLHAWLKKLLTDIESPVTSPENLATVTDIKAALRNESTYATQELELDSLLACSQYSICPFQDFLEVCD